MTKNKTMTKYQKQKGQARQQAVELQNEISQKSLYYSDLVYYQDIFLKLGKRFGLIREFRENGLI